MRSILSVLVVLISLSSVLKAEDEKILRIGIGQEFDSLRRRPIVRVSYKEHQVAKKW